MISLPPGFPLDWSADEFAAANAALAEASPREIIAWAIGLEGLIQATSFQPSGLVILEHLHDLGARVPVIFLDTLHHFPETLALVEAVQVRFQPDLRVYRPAGAATRAQFELQHGPALWERDLDRYQELTKVEPMRRALAETRARAWLTGRRRDQGGERGTLEVVEVRGGRVKINPLAGWDKRQVWAFLLERGTPYNALHDRGYASIGDEPLTEPAGSGEGDRTGRWKGKGRTECGIHTEI